MVRMCGVLYCECNTGSTPEDVHCDKDQAREPSEEGEKRDRPSLDSRKLRKKDPDFRKEMGG